MKDAAVAASEGFAEGVSSERQKELSKKVATSSWLESDRAN